MLLKIIKWNVLIFRVWKLQIPKINFLNNTQCTWFEKLKIDRNVLQRIPFPVQTRCRRLHPSKRSSTSRMGSLEHSTKPNILIQSVLWNFYYSNSNYRSKLQLIFIYRWLDVVPSIIYEIPSMKNVSEQPNKSFYRQTFTRFHHSYDNLSMSIAHRRN